jgi:hypothetical protein
MQDEDLKATISDLILEYSRRHFEPRDLELIQNCQTYANNSPAGLPGHALILLVAKLAALISRIHDQVSQTGGD